MRENTLIFPLCRDTLGCGRTEISCSTGSVKNGLHGCNGKGEGFPRFSESRGAVLIWHSLRGPGEGTCLGKGQQSEVCSILARLRILERPNLRVAGTKAEQLSVSAMGKVQVSKHSSAHLGPGRGLVLQTHSDMI